MFKVLPRMQYQKHVYAVGRHKHRSIQFVTCPDPRRVESYLKDTIQDGIQVCYPPKLKSSECMLLTFWLQGRCADQLTEREIDSSN